VGRAVALLVVSLPWFVCCSHAPGEVDEAEPEPCLDPGRTECVGHTFRTCVDGFWEITEVCAAPTPQCSVSMGCIACGAGQDYCIDNAVYHCDDHGTDWALTEECGDRTCRWGTCYEPCGLAAAEASYLGCEFLAVQASNTALVPAFDDDFGLVVGNPDPERDATVEIRRGGAPVSSITVDAGTSRSVTLPFDPELKAASASVIVRGSAWEILSDLPVVAYQYNPLHFATAIENSYTNDASLLLPVAALGRQHLVTSWPSFGFYDAAEGWGWSPGFLAVTAPTDGTHVYVTSSAWTLGGDLDPLQPGQSAEVVLDRGDVLQLFSETTGPDDPCYALEGAIQGVATTSYAVEYPVCLNVERGDLTGSQVRADRPIAVFAGHDCAFIPFEKFACDHMEESSLPAEVWGAEAVVSAPVLPGMGSPAPTLIRVLALADGTEVRFEPAIHEPVLAGPALPIDLRVDKDVVVSATGPILVTQYMLGEQELGVGAGDPAMGTMPPTDHWRTSYEFLVPDTYEDDYVNLTTRLGATVHLDGEEILDWMQVGDSDYQVHRASLAPGPHSAHSEADPFGLVAYGYADYTSYLYPGGLDLTHAPLP